MTDSLAVAWSALTTQVAALLQVALDVEPAGGVSAAWGRQLEALGVPPHDEATRYDVARASGLTRGVPLDELAACLDQLLTRARAHLAPLVAGRTAQQQAQLEQALGSLRAEAHQRYRALASERPQKLFSFARKAAGQRQASAAALVDVLKCATCGAPRTSAADFGCGFCGGEVRPA